MKDFIRNHKAAAVLLISIVSAVTTTVVVYGLMENSVRDFNTAMCGGAMAGAFVLLVGGMFALLSPSRAKEKRR